MGTLLFKIKTKDTTKILGSLCALVFTLIVLKWIFHEQPSAEKILKWEEVAYVDQDGDTKLKDWRIIEIKRKITEMEQAEQYVLLAASDSAYECFHCPRGITYLRKGQVWKYGVTRKGVGGRYDAGWLNRMHLSYRVQLEGTFQECLVEELRKIGLYPLHPDNLSRELHNRLARPPGNKMDG